MSGLFSHGLSWLESMMDLKTAIKCLMPPRYSEVLEALLLKDEEPEKVAQRLEITIENLYNLKSRALAKLIKEHLQDYIIE